MRLRDFSADSCRGGDYRSDCSFPYTGGRYRYGRADWRIDGVRLWERQHRKEVPT
jgi:hypothetical protein